MYKKIALACALISCSSVAFAGETGWYLGLQAGYADTDYSTSDSANYFKNTLNVSGTSKQSNDNSGAVGRVYLGYQFMDYLAAEVGYSYYEKYDYNNLYGVNNASGDLQQQTGDLVLKPILPLSQKFDLYAIAGAAYVHTQASVDSTAKNAGITDKTQTAVRPEYGLGAEMYFKQYWSVDLSWREFTSGGNVEQSQQAMIGIAYHFHNPDDDNF